MELTDQDYELLSAYLDNDLDAVERARLEARLSAEPELRRELAALRQTVQLVHQLPALKAPRDFRLTPAMIENTGQRQGDQPQLTVLPPTARSEAVTQPARTLHNRPGGSRTHNFVLPILSAAASLVLVLFGLSLLLTGNAARAPAASEQTGSVARLSTPAMTATSADFFSVPDGSVEMQDQTDQLSQKQMTTDAVATDMASASSEADDETPLTANALTASPSQEPMIMMAPATMESETNDIVPPVAAGSAMLETAPQEETDSENTGQSVMPTEQPLMTFSSVLTSIPNLFLSVTPDLLNVAPYGSYPAPVTGGELPSSAAADSAIASTSGFAAGTPTPQGTVSPVDDSRTDSGTGNAARSAPSTQAAFALTATPVITKSASVTPTMTLTPETTRDADGVIATSPTATGGSIPAGIVLIGAGILLGAVTLIVTLRRRSS